MATEKDGRAKNGGARKGAGRPKRTDEEELLRKLSTMDALAFRILKKGLAKGDVKYFNIFMNYRYGKPQNKVDITTGGKAFDMPIVSFFKTINKEKK